MLNIQRIIGLRTERGWDQKQLAQVAKIDASVISRLEKGEQQDFKLSVIVAIANALGVTVDGLLENPQETYVSGLTPELQAEIIQLYQQSEKIQRHIAGVIRGYMSGLED